MELAADTNTVAYKEDSSVDDDDFKKPVVVRS
jgi:hypothetical protein